MVSVELLQLFRRLYLDLRHCLRFCLFLLFLLSLLLTFGTGRIFELNDILSFLIFFALFLALSLSVFRSGFFPQDDKDHKECYECDCDDWKQHIQNYTLWLIKVQRYTFNKKTDVWNVEDQVNQCFWGCFRRGKALPFRRTFCLKRPIKGIQWYRSFCRWLDVLFPSNKCVNLPSKSHRPHICPSN